MSSSFDYYNIKYNCQNAPNTVNFANWLNQPDVRSAIHAPNKTYAACNATVFDTLQAEDVTPPDFAIIPSFLEQGIAVHIWSGDDDFLMNHIGTELIIQNMTWYDLCPVTLGKHSSPARE